MDTYDTNTGNGVRHATKADHEGMFTKPVKHADFSQGPSAGASSTPGDWSWPQGASGWPGDAMRRLGDDQSVWERSGGFRDRSGGFGRRW